MKNILIEMKKEQIEKIISGQKKYHYKDLLAKEEIQYIYLCEWENKKELPMVIAKVEVKDKLILPINELWEQTKNFAGITKEFYDKYFLNKKIARAYALGEVEVFDKPYSIQKYGIKYPPRKFLYIS